MVIGSRELTEAELLMPLFSDYVQKVFRDAKTGNGQKWLMLEVRDKEIMNNVFELINLRKRRYMLRLTSSPYDSVSRAAPVRLHLCFHQPESVQRNGPPVPSRGKLPACQMC